jgi:hypothetical protein
MLFDARFVTQGLSGCDRELLAQLLDVLFEGQFYPALLFDLTGSPICGEQAKRTGQHARPT